MKVNLQDGKENGRLNPSIEWQKQIIYLQNIAVRKCHYLYSQCIYSRCVTSHALKQVIKEANIVVGNPGNTPS